MFKKTISTTVLTILVISMFTAVFHVYNIRAEPGTTIYPYQSKYMFNIKNATVGTLFNVSIWVKEVTDLCAYEIQIRYNSTMLDCLDAIEPKSDPHYVLYSIVPYTMTFKTHDVGKYTIAGGQLPGNPAAHFNGTGIITIFKFKILKVATKAGNLISTLNINNTQTFMIDQNGDNIPNVAKIDGYYEMDWVAPPKPRMAISPTDQSFDAYSNHTGEKFTETVLIKSLDIGWELTKASFCLCYNTTLINVTQYWIDSLWQNSTVTYTADTWDTLNVTVWNPTATPSGDVNLIVIEFVILHQEVSPPRPAFSYDETPLFFSSHALSDHTFQIPEETPIEGKVRIYCMIRLQFPDIAIEDVWASKTIWAQGYSANITVTVRNLGDQTETFNVTAYANTTSIATKTVTLQHGNFTIITFTWNTTGFAKGYYNISAYAWPVKDEINIDNNRLTDGQVKVVTPGNVNGDGIVNMLDIYTELILRFMYIRGDPGYRANSDINDDGIINYQDIYIAILHFMQTDLDP